MQNRPLRLISRALEYVRIRDHYFGSVLEYLPQRFGSISGLRHHLHVRFIVEQSPQSLAQQDMVVDKKATNFFIANHFIALYLCGGAHRATPFYSGQRDFAMRRGYGLNRNG
jgi:hypothetical protein